MRGRRLLLATVAGCIALPAAPALAADTYPAPSLTLQSSFSPPTGVARTDLIDQTTSTPHASAVDGDRIYTVGEAGSGTSGDVGIIVHRTDGTLDTSFSDDGKLVIPIAAGNVEDSGVDIVVLPDHGIRILAVTGAGSARDTAIVGLMPDGGRDPVFGAADGTADGIVTFGAHMPDTPAAMALAPDGRLAVTGDGGQSGNDDVFVSLRNADGTPVATFGSDTTGTVVFDRGGNPAPDSGVDVLFRPGGGVLVLAQVDVSGATAAVLHAFTDLGTDDPSFSDDADLVLAVGDAPTVPTALLLYANRLWVTGSTRTGVDTNAFLARVEADGSGLQSRQFDMRGQLIDPAQAVTSQGSGLTLVPGTPDTLVVTGSVSSASSTDWAAAAFNNLDGDVASAGFGDIAISIPGSGGINGSAGGNGAAAVTGPYQETVTTPSSSITYTRIGDARLLVDAEKTCNLKLEVTKPLELDLRPGSPGTVSLRVTNGGTRACAGTIAVPDPYALAAGGTPGPVATGLLAPGASFTATGVQLTYGGPLRPADTLKFTLTATGDVDAADNTALLHVRFSYCDLVLTSVGSAAFVPDEGTRRFSFAVRNGGTVACPGVRVAVGGQGRAGAREASYKVDAGRDVADDVAAGLTKRLPPGTRVLLGFLATGTGDVNFANNAVARAATVLGVGDTDAARPRGAARAFRGVARAGRGPASRKLRHVKRVSVAVRRLGRGCRWLASARARRFRTLHAGAKGGCTRPVWLRANGTRRWSLKTHGLPAGRYVLMSRATIGAGFSEASFSARDRNRVPFRVAG